MTKLHYRIQTELLFTDGEVRDFRLDGGLALAYAGDKDEGNLTLSRPAPVSPSAGEIGIVQREFAIAALTKNLPILSWQEVGRPIVQNKSGKHYAVRLKVFFGEQPPLF